MKTNILKLILFVCFAEALHAMDATAQNPNVGTAGATFLRIPIGARAAAMGGAAVASISDASSLFWNPAGITGVQSAELVVSHIPWWATTRLNSLALVAAVGDVGSIGVSVTSLAMDKMEVTTEDQPDGTGEMFDAADLMIGLTYARRLTDNFSVGITAKYINQRIWNETANGWAFDVGTQYRIGFRDLTLAMSLTNFGPDMTFDGRDLDFKYSKYQTVSTSRLAPARLTPEEYPLPLLFQVGLAMTAFQTEGFALLLAADVAHPNDNSERLNTGAEIAFLDYFRIRGGYRFGYDQESSTFGAGVTLPIGDTRLRVDYGYVVYDLLPGISRFTVGMTF